MLEFWNNVETVSKIYTWAQVSLAVFAVLTGISIVVAMKTGGRKEYLKEQKTRIERQTERKPLETRAKELQSQVDAAKAESGELRSQFEASEKRVRELEEKQKPRQLDSSQLLRLSQSVSRFAGQAVEIWITPGSGEEKRNLAAQIATGLRRGGWKARIRGTVGNATVSGVEVRIGAGESYPFAEAVLAGLQGAGIAVHAIRFARRPAGYFEIMVGDKP